MHEENHAIVAGIVIGIIVLLIAASFIFILVTYSNKRKKTFIEEKKMLEILFKQQLLQSQLEMQEQTFDSISKEIHDNVGQVLSLAKVQVNIIEQKRTLDPVLLADVKESIGKAMVDLRDIAKSLNSDRIKQCSLPEMTNHELQRISRVGITKTFLHTEGKAQNVIEQKKLIIFRIIQESLQNILKHADAKKIDVLFYYDTDHLTCEISDDGNGFDPAIISRKEGLGLQNMINRAALINGEVKINSIIGKGTTITIKSNYE
jgi:two-component system NarL family sensor kinase